MATPDKKLASIETPILILVEGITDKEFIERLLSNLDCFKEVKEKFTIYPAGSYEKIGSYLKNIKSIRGLPQLKVLAVIADADENPVPRKQEIESECANLVDVNFKKIKWTPKSRQMLK